MSKYRDLFPVLIVAALTLGLPHFNEKVGKFEQYARIKTEEAKLAKQHQKDTNDNNNNKYV